jgi:hypothetical protein
MELKKEQRSLPQKSNLDPDDDILLIKYGIWEALK